MQEKITFDPKFTTSAIAHVNEDHRDALVDILQGISKATWVVDAELLHFDKKQMQIQGFGVNGKKETFEIPYNHALEQSKEFRPMLIEILKQARKLLK